MSKDECMDFLRTHSGRQSTLAISEGTANNIDSVRTYMHRLEKDEAVVVHRGSPANRFNEYEVRE